MTRHSNFLATDFCRYIAVFLLAGFSAWTPHLRAQETAEVQDLKIVVLEGEEGVNIIKKKSAVRPVVEVRDKNDLPIAGVSVIFLLPSSGPSAAFLNGEKSLTVLTDSNGRAAASSMRPQGTGSFKINVRASFQGKQASMSINQTNYLTVAAAQSAGAPVIGSAGATAGGLSTGVIVGVVAGVAAAAAVGIVAATKGGGSSSNPVSSPAPAGTISLGAGGIVFGSPH